MKKNISVLVICLMALMTCSYAAKGDHGAQIKQLRAEHKITQQSENAAFRASLVGKTKAERVALKAEHRAIQQQENLNFRAQIEAQKAQWKAEKAQREAERNANGTTTETGTGSVSE